MKKILFAIVAVAMSISAMAQKSSLTVNGVVERESDGYYGLPISLDNQESLTALQFRAKCTEGLAFDSAVPSAILKETYMNGRSEEPIYVPNWDSNSNTFTVYCKKNPMQIIKSGEILTLWVNGGEVDGTVTLYNISGSIEVAAGEKAPDLPMDDLVIEIKDGKATNVKANNADETVVKAQKFMTKKGLVITKGNKKYNAAAQEVK